MIMNIFNFIFGKNFASQLENIQSTFTKALNKANELQNKILESKAEKIEEIKNIESEIEELNTLYTKNDSFITKLNDLLG